MIFVCSFRENVVKNRTGVKIFNFFNKNPSASTVFKKGSVPVNKIDCKTEHCILPAQHCLVFKVILKRDIDL